MESFFGSKKIMQNVLVYIFFALLFLPVFVIFFRMYRKRKIMRNALEKLPTLKIRMFNFLGHMSFLINHYLFRYPAPFTAYIPILMTGITEVYGKDGLFQVWQVLRPGVVVYRAEAVEVILSHNTELKKSWFYEFLHPWLGEGLLTSNGAKWKQRRKLLTPAFHFNILKDFLIVFNKQSKIMVDVLQAHTKEKYVDIVPLVSRCSFDIICETILGEEMHSQTEEDCDYLKSVNILAEIHVERTLKAWLWPDILFRLSSPGRRMRYYTKKVSLFANTLIEKKKKEKLEMKSLEKDKPKNSEDEERMNDKQKKRALLDLLIDEHIDNDSISVEDIREEVDTFTFEGHDTTSMGMSWALYLIGHHQDVQEKIHAELDSLFGDGDRDPTMDDLRDMKYLECVLKESSRIYPTVPGYGRELQEDLDFKGHIVPKGCTCFIWAYGLHRDPEVFPNPEVFDPDRFTPENSAGRHPFAYVPFSAGPRNCIGQKFALMEEKCVISAILRKYTVKSLQPRDQVHDTFVIALRPHGGLKLEIRDRK